MPWFATEERNELRKRIRSLNEEIESEAALAARRSAENDASCTVESREAWDHDWRITSMPIMSNTHEDHPSQSHQSGCPGKPPPQLGPRKRPGLIRSQVNSLQRNKMARRPIPIYKARWELNPCVDSALWGPLGIRLLGNFGAGLKEGQTCGVTH